jgi:fatty acid desaturase
VLFEAYHALHRGRPLKTLALYEITPAAAKGSPGRFVAEERFGPAPYDWDETLASPFRHDLLACATRYFQQECARRQLTSLRAATKAPLRRWVEIALFAVVFFASVPFLVQGSWIALVATPVLGWLFVVNFWHDALHFSLSRSWRLNAAVPYLFPWFISPVLWMHEHVIGHHVFTNDPLRDPDIRTAPHVLRQAPGIAWCAAHRKQGRLGRVLVLYALWVAVANVIRDHLLVRGWFNDAVPLAIHSLARRWLHVAERVVVATSLFVWPFFLFPFWKAAAFAIAPSLIFSELFLLFSQVNHVTWPNLEAGDVPSSNWYESQARASCSYGTDSYVAFLLSGGLNLQIEHHLLPGVNHAHLFRLSPEIRQICARHGVPYHSYPTFGAALRAHFAAIKRLGEDPRPRHPRAPQ